MLRVLNHLLRNSSHQSGTYPVKRFTSNVFFLSPFLYIRLDLWALEVIANHFILMPDFFIGLVKNAGYNFYYTMECAKYSNFKAWK